MVSMIFRTSVCAWFVILRRWHQLPQEHCVDSKLDVLTLSIDANTLLIRAPATSRTHSLPLHPRCDGLREATRAGKEICSWMNSGSLWESKPTAGCRTGSRGNPSESAEWFRACLPETTISSLVRWDWAEALTLHLDLLAQPDHAAGCRGKARAMVMQWKPGKTSLIIH